MCLSNGTQKPSERYPTTGYLYSVPDLKSCPEEAARQEVGKHDEQIIKCLKTWVNKQRTICESTLQ